MTNIEVLEVNLPSRAHLDDVVEDDYIEDFPGSAGEPTGKTKKTSFEKIRKMQRKAEEEAWGPFRTEEEWDLARWLMTSSVSQTKLDEFLKLPLVHTVSMIGNYIC